MRIIRIPLVLCLLNLSVHINRQQIEVHLTMIPLSLISHLSISVAAQLRQREVNKLIIETSLQL